MIDIKLKRMFFDRKAVTDRIGKVRVRILSRVGAFVRKRAQTSMRYRKRASLPGTPPSAHKETGALLRRLLFFAYDPASDSVVVGPIRAKSGEAPSLQEFGGTARRRGKIVTYQPRPYMEPALRAEEPKLPKAWANSVSR